jgi:uncharacterized membrane protein
MADARQLHRALLAFIVLGLGFSLYAGFEALDPALSSVCSVNGFVSCGVVLRSGDTTFPPGTPLSDWAWGVAGFVALLALDVPLLRTYSPRLLTAVTGLAAAGVALAVVFAYIELAIIHALCPVCLGAYFSGVGVLACALTLQRIRRAESDSDSPPRSEPVTGLPE